jgi:hypothetical protein
MLMSLQIPLEVRCLMFGSSISENLLMCILRPCKVILWCIELFSIILSFGFIIDQDGKRLQLQSIPAAKRLQGKGTQPKSS